VNETMSKLYRRIQVNTTKHFGTALPPTEDEWRAGKSLIRMINCKSLVLENQQTSCMIIACDKLLKPIISQSECLNIDKRFDIYEKILSVFIQAWTSMLLERKYTYL
jgi:hypothetical protein